MILVVGGAFQGKKEYVMQNWGLSEDMLADGRSCDRERLFQAKAILHFHEYLRRCLQEQQSIHILIQELVSRNPEVIVIANELGYGVVPVDAFDREYRETVGRTCCMLAKEAQEVHRVVCGVGMVIKHG